MTAQISDEVIVIGRNEIGAVAESMGMRYYLTPCCGASAKGSESGIVCRACYYLIDEALGGLPEWDPLTEVYGDGLTYEDWKARR